MNYDKGYMLGYCYYFMQLNKILRNNKIKEIANS